MLETKRRQCCIKELDIVKLGKGVNKVSNKAGDEPNYKEMFSQSCGQLIRQRSKLEKLGGSRYKAEVQNY